MSTRGRGVRRVGSFFFPLVQARAMSLMQLNALSGSHRSFAEREEIALPKAQGLGVREIACSIGRAPSARSRVSCAAMPLPAVNFGLSGVGCPNGRLSRSRAGPRRPNSRSTQSYTEYVADRLAGTIRLERRLASPGSCGTQRKGRNKGPSPGPAMGHGVELRADRSPGRRLISPMMDSCGSPMRP